MCAAFQRKMLLGGPQPDELLEIRVNQLRLLFAEAPQVFQAAVLDARGRCIESSPATARRWFSVHRASYSRYIQRRATESKGG